MTLNQINEIKKLFPAIENEEQLYERTVEIDEAIKNRELSAVFMKVADQLGISRAVSLAASESPEYEDVISEVSVQIAGILAKWEKAYEIIAARDAA